MGYAKAGIQRTRLTTRKLLVLGALGLFLMACSDSATDPEAVEETNGADANQQVSAVDSPTAAALPLQFLPAVDAVYCDGTSRTAGEVRGALPGEAIRLTSALPVEVEPGIADDQGTYVLTWSCEPAEARLKWDITAVGDDSGRQVAFIIAGSAEDPEVTDLFTVSLDDEPFICDGERKPIGDVTGAEPFETITFRSDQVDGISDGQANASGATRLFWRCDVDEAGTTWEVRLWGADSFKTGEFNLTAAPFSEADIPNLAVTMLEDPFLCDGESRPLAAVTGLAPLEVVDFSSDDASGLIDGRADSEGGLTARWQCGRDDIGKTWQVKAEGVSSGRSTVLTIAGGAPPEGTFKDVTITYLEDLFRCDGESRQFATLANFLSREFVDFDSPDSGPLRQGQADQTGSLPIRWQCEPGEEAKTWQVTATGTTSKKSITFIITAAP